MMDNERRFQRSLRDVRKVGLKQARVATRAFSRRKVVLQRRNRAFTDTNPFRQRAFTQGPKSLVGTVKEIGGALAKVAKGQAPFPLPVFGGTGRAMQIRAITRQQIARVPLPAKIIGGAVGVTAVTEAVTGQSPIPLARQGLMGLGRGLGQQLSGSGPRRRTQQMPSRGLAVGQELPPSHQVVRVWQTFPGGPVFARLADGHIAVQKKDGTIKHFRPYRPVVIPRKWNARSMSRVATALKRQRKTATKIMQITGGMPKGRK